MAPATKVCAMVRPIAGLGLLLGSFVAFVVLSFWMFASNLVPRTGNWLIDWLREDQYYCLLVPLTLPVTLLFAYFTWFTNDCGALA